MKRRQPTIDAPPAAELLALVAEFLEQELAPAQPDEKLRYRTRVAANLLRIARRELDGIGDLAVDADGRAVPADVLASAGSLQAFADALASGERSLTDPASYALAARCVDAKLAIAIPEALAPRAAD